MQERVQWAWLSAKEISPRAKAALIARFGNASQVFSASDSELRSIKGIGEKEISQLQDHDLQRAEQILSLCEKKGIELLPVTDASYPARLREIYAAPILLYVLGQLPPVDDLPVVSVIGTRNASPYGIKMGRELAYQIACCGGTVATLLTAGVDEAAAAGALLADRPCLAVLGTPVDACRSHYRDRLLTNGAILSEYPPGMPQRKHFFRERNRVAAGLSVGVVVIEAPEKSGTRLFVAEAIDQGKDVFALPGNADAENAAGTLALLKEGATLVTSGKDVMGEYVHRFPGIVSLQDAKPAPVSPEEDAEASDNPDSSSHETAHEKSAVDQYKEKLKELSEDQLRIVSVIDRSSTHIDDIIERTGFSAAKVLAQLTLLEIKGFVRREIGKRFSLNIAKEQKK